MCPIKEADEQEEGGPRRFVYDSGQKPRAEAAEQLAEADGILEELERHYAH